MKKFLNNRHESYLNLSPDLSKNQTRLMAVLYETPAKLLEINIRVFLIVVRP